MVPMLSMKANTDFAGEVACCIEPNIVFANETIMREKTTGEAMYFIHSGVVEIFVSASQLSSYVAIGDGCVSDDALTGLLAPSKLISFVVIHFFFYAKYFGEVSVLLGIQRTASARSKTQCLLYRLSKSKLLPLLHDYPFVETKMTEVAQSRRRRLAHYLDPKIVPLDPLDEVDAEDCQTELFGVDADTILRAKQEEATKEMLHSGRRRIQTINGGRHARHNANINQAFLANARRGYGRRTR
jgi:CRP-like cAMP-binding protein